MKIATLVGCAIGDALGNPFEMKLADYEPLQEWDGLFKDGGTFWKGKAGQYTDDTLMSIALSASLIEKNGFDPKDVASKYLMWLESGNTRGIGITTSMALNRLKNVSYLDSGVSFNYDGTPVGGNGTAMRVSPIGLVYRNDLSKLIECAQQDAVITHNSLEPQAGSIAVALATGLLVNRVSSPESIIKDILDILPESEVKNKLLLAQELLEDGTDIMDALAIIGSAGYVPETVGAAFYCLGSTDNFKDAVVLSVKAGGDTDTTGAVCGALAGTWYGLEDIPNEYKSVENFELLNELTQELINIDI